MNLFHFASGVDPETIALCSSAEKKKYAILGSLIYIPLVTGMVAVLFACLYHTHNALAIAFICLVWGGVVFIIERSLISSLRPGTFSLAVLFRIILAFAMSLIISELLILFVFNEDVETTIRQRHAAQLALIRAEGDRRVDSLNREIARAQTLVEQADDDLLLETNGTGGSRHYGDGPAQRAAQARLERRMQNYSTLKTRLEAQIETIQQETRQILSETRENQTLGLLDALNTLHERAHERRIIAIVLWIAHVFFLTVELMPLVVKLSFKSKGNQYYTILDSIDEKQIEAMRLTMEQRQNVLKLEAEYELKKREIEIGNQMLQLRLQQAADQAILSSEILLGTLATLNRTEIEGGQQIDTEHTAQYKQQIEELITAFLTKSRSVLTT